MEAGLFCHAWDFAGRCDEFLDWAAESGIRQLYFAGTYHAGWLLHPHAQRHRAFMLEDGVCYFHPEASLYDQTRLKPQVAQICCETDWLREAASKAKSYGLKVVSWTIGTHNTRLGLAHPECATQNCFGDTYPHALCPAHPEVREYLKALCSDLTHNLPLQGVLPESFGYLGWRHGHHHERDLTGLTNVDVRLMNICFHPATVEQAARKNVDGQRLKKSVADLLGAAMLNAPQRPPNHPANWDEVRALLPELEDYMNVCRYIERTLMHEVKDAMRPGAELHLSGYNEDLRETGSSFSCSVYGQSPQQTRETVAAFRSKLPDSAKLHVGVRLGMGVPESEAQCQAIVAAIKEAGGDMVLFYNASESPPAMLRWIKPTMKAVNA